MDNEVGAAKVESRISNALNELRQRIDSLEKTSEVLAMRLAPIACKTVLDEYDKPKVAGETGSNVFEIISETCHRINTLDENMSQLTGTLEI